MGEEIGTGYVRLLPSLKGFRRAASRELKAALVGPARDAGEEAGGELADGATRAAAKKSKPAGRLFGKDFAKGVKSGLVVMGDPTTGVWMGPGPATDLGRKIGDGIGDGVDDGLDLRGRLVKAFQGDGENSIAGFGSKLLGQFRGMFQVSAKTAATAFSAQFVGSVVAGLASGAVKIAHGVGAAAALVPAALFAGVAALGTLKLAFAGVGDALGAAMTGDAKEFDEAIKGLSPSARGFAREVRGMRGDLKGLKDTVQERFFEQFSGQASKLGKTFLPMLRRELGGIAGAFGGAADRMASWARTPAVVLTIGAALGNARKAVSHLADGATNLAAAFLPLVAVGSTFLPRLTRGFGNATSEFARFMQNAADSGKLADFIQGGLDKLHSLGDTFSQIVRIGRNVFAIFREFGSVGSIFSGLGIQTGGLLDSFEALSEKAKAFFQSSAGGEAITEIVSTIRSLLSATMGTLAHLVPIIGRAFGPILPQLSKFSEAVANIQLALADAMEPALQAVADALGVILPPLTTLLNVMADNQVVMGAMAGVLLGVVGGWKAGGVAVKLLTQGLSGLKLSMAGVAGAAAGVSMALLAVDSQRHAKETEEWVEGLVALDGSLTPASRGAVYLAQVTGTLNERMGALIDANPRVAQQILDNAAAFGISADDAAAYQAELDQTTAATENATDAITRQKNALRAMSDPVFAAIDAQQRLGEAQAHVTELEASGTATAAELQAAHQDVARAAFDLDGAMLGLGSAMESGETSMSAVLAAMKAQVKQGSITRADYNATAFVAAASMGRAKEAVEAVPRQHATSLVVRDFASSVIAKVAEKMRRLNGTHATVSIGATVAGAIGATFGALSPKRKHHKGRIGGDEYVALLQRGESVLAAKDPLNKALLAANKGKAMPAGAVASASTLESLVGRPSDGLGSASASQVAVAPSRLVVDVTGGSDEMIKVIRKWIANNTTGDVQLALGTR